MSSLAFYLTPEPPSQAQLQEALKPHGFKKPLRAWRDLASLASPPFDREAWEPLLPLMLREFSNSPDPNLSLSQFSTFAEKTFHRSQFYEYLLQNPPAREAMAKIMGLSPFLASILFQEPGLFYWLFIEEGLYSKFVPAKLEELFRLEMEAAGDLEGKLNALRRVKKRRMLRLGARDILGLSHVRDLTLELSDMADLVLQKALALAKEALAPRYPSPPPGKLVVLGMGKLGGRELNYYSDVDLLFVYESTGGVERAEEARRYFNDLAEWMITTLPFASSHGPLYKVDMRLRPEGLGDMARSLDGYLEHYENRGQPWELQALLKARPCAGDLELGERFLREVEPIIFRKNLDTVYLNEIREIMGLIKLKMESKGRGKDPGQAGGGGNPRDRVHHPIPPASPRGRPPRSAVDQQPGGPEGLGLRRVPAEIRRQGPGGILRIPAPGGTPLANGARPPDPHPAFQERGFGADRQVPGLQGGGRPLSRQAFPIRLPGNHPKGPRTLSGSLQNQTPPGYLGQGSRGSPGE